MSDRISPPSWTEWTRNPSERSPSRKAFDDIAGELRKDGLIEARGSLFVHLARYSYLHVKNARIEVKAFIQSVPDEIFRQVSPGYRVSEVDAVLRLLASAGLLTIEEDSGSNLVQVLLTERRAAGEVARGQELQTVLAHLKQFYSQFDSRALVAKNSTFPTLDSVAKAAGMDRAGFSDASYTAVHDRPESNETNNRPFLQETLEGAGPVALLRFWSLPDPKSPGPEGQEPEFSILMPTYLTLSNLVRDYALPVLGEFFRATEHRDLASEIQTKYTNYMHKYREKFTSAPGIPTIDKVDKVLSTSDLEGEAFANAIYVVAQVLRAAQRVSSNGRPGPNPIVVQATRIAYANAMAARVKKRRGEKEAAAKTQDAGLLVNRLREANRPLSIDDLKSTKDITKNKEIGTKYPSVIELLPLVPATEGVRPPVFEIHNSFIHRERLITTFLEFREKESIAQRERLARLWAKFGIPAVEDLVLAEREVSPDFLRVFELLHQERLVTPGTPDFLKDFIPNETDVYKMAPLVWPEGHRGAVTPMEIVRGLDAILYEDKDRLRRRPLAGVLDLARAYASMEKATWNIIFMEEGLFSFVARKIASWFGGRSKPVREPEVESKSKGGSGSGSGSGSSKGRGGAGAGSGSGSGSGSSKAADLKKLKELAPILQDREVLVLEREKTVSQWCLKLDPEANRRTRQAVDDEIARLVPKILPEQLSEENGAKVALFLVEKSSVLEQVTSSRAFHRYLYLTALQRKADSLGR